MQSDGWYGRILVMFLLNVLVDVAADSSCHVEIDSLCSSHLLNTRRYSSPPNLGGKLFWHASDAGDLCRC